MLPTKSWGSAESLDTSKGQKTLIFVPSSRSKSAPNNFVDGETEVQIREAYAQVHPKWRAEG